MTPEKERAVASLLRQLAAVLDGEEDRAAPAVLAPLPKKRRRVVPPMPPGPVDELAVQQARQLLRKV